MAMPQMKEIPVSGIYGFSNVYEIDLVDGGARSEVIVANTEEDAVRAYITIQLEMGTKDYTLKRALYDWRVEYLRKESGEMASEDIQVWKLGIQDADAVDTDETHV